MKNLLKLLKEFVCGVRREPVDVISTGFHSYYPPNQPTEAEWNVEFNVGMLYDRKIVHL